MKKPAKTCRGPDCDRTDVVARGLCTAHVRQLSRHTVLRPLRRSPLRGGKAPTVQLSIRVSLATAAGLERRAAVAGVSMYAYCQEILRNY